MMIPLDELIQDFHLKPRGIVHIGAHEGQELDSYVQNGIQRVLWIEANPEICAVLKERLRPHPNHRAYQFAAHEKDGLTVDLNVMVNTMSSSILWPKKHLEFYPSITVTEKISVTTRKMDSFFKAEEIPLDEFNFLNMDIQGAELMVLKGMTESLKHFEYVYTEVNDDYLFEGCCLTPELDEFLGRQGFQRVVKRMTSDKWGDALYVRE
jgi:FkbM family methyltransferase